MTGRGGEDKARVAAAGDDGRDCGVDVRVVLPRSGTPDFNYWPSSLRYAVICISHPPQHAVLPFFFADVEEEEPEHRGAAVRDGGIFLSRLSPDDGGGGGGSSGYQADRVRDAFATWQGAPRRIMDN